MDVVAIVKNQGGNRRWFSPNMSPIKILITMQTAKAN
jgi:hypothetical protein